MAGTGPQVGGVIRCEVCAEQVDPDGLLRHLRLFHPMSWDDEDDRVGCVIVEAS